MLFNRIKQVHALEEKVRQLEADLEKAKLSEKRFLDALNLSPMALCHHDTDLKYTWLYNPHMGFVQEDVIGKTDWDILDKNLADRMGVIKRRVLETGIGERVEMPSVEGDEDSEYFDLVVEPLNDPFSGNVVGIACSGIDVTDDRRRREAYKAAESNLRFIFNSFAQPVIVSQLDNGQPMFFNQAAADLFSISETTKKDRNILLELGLEESLIKLFDEGQLKAEGKIEYQIKEDETRHVLYFARKIFFDGQVAVLSTFNDVSKEIAYQEELKAAKEEAELASMAKSQFLAAASHDLRQPLHAMGMLLTVLENYIEEDAGKEILNRVTSSLEAMNDLFSGILDISKLDANVVPVELATISLNDIFMSMESEFVTLAEEKGLALSFAPTGLQVKTDKIQCQRMLRNLIANAIRYTPSGSISIFARRDDERVVVDVQDTGMGISDADQKLIFQEFRQIGNPERDRRKGLGLGLAICERISDLLNSKLQVSSVLGEGSCFSFSLPFVEMTNVQSKTKKLKDHDLFSGQKILFIEDEEDVQIATKYMLESWGCHALIASNIEEAVSLSMGGCPNMIVADYRLRDQQTGLDAILEVRKITKQNVPAVVLSGDTSPSLIKTLESHGLGLLNKPVLPKELKNCLKQIINQVPAA